MLLLFKEKLVSNDTLSQYIMPRSYVRRYNRKFNRYAKRNTINPFNSARRNASLALRTANQVKSLINVEWKNVDTTFSDNTITTTAQIVNLDGCAQGDTSITRDGKSQFNKSVYVRGVLRSDADQTGDSIVRAMLVMDYRKVSGSDFAITDLLNEESVDAINNLSSNQSRFKVLWDRYFILAPAGLNKKTFTVYKKLSFHTKYSGTTSTSGAGPSIYLVLISDLLTDPPLLNGHARVRFIDN